jgi:thiol-disulfide isomerase/thioredoxin
MKNLRIIGIVSCLAAMSAGVLLLAQNTGAEASASPAVNSASAPSWKLQDLDGRTVQSADFKDKVVILDFWATWCGPCRREIPGFIDLQKQYADKGLIVVGVSLDQGGASAVKSYTAKAGINYPVVLGDETIVRAFGGVEAIPTTFIIDRKGRIVNKHVGFVPKAEFETEIKPLLKR